MIGNRIKNLRLEKNMTQSELSRLVNVPQNTLSDIEHDYYEPKVSALSRFANALGITVDDLLDSKEVTK